MLRSLMAAIRRSEASEVDGSQRRCISDRSEQQKLRRPIDCFRLVEYGFYLGDLSLCQTIKQYGVDMLLDGTKAKL